MDTKQLKYFLDVANCLNFTRAAQQNHMAQAAMSQHIISLENQLGFRLFERNNRTVKLTKMGDVFYYEAVKILGLVERTENYMQTLIDGVEGTLKIGFLGEHESDFLPGLLSAYKEKFPNVSIELIQDISRRLEEMLDNDELDIIFKLQNQIPSSEFSEILVATQELCAVFPEGHPLINKKPLSRKDLANEPMVFMRPSSDESMYTHMVKDSLNAGYMPKMAGYASSIQGLLMMVECGIGVTVLPKSCDIGKSDVVFVPLDDTIKINIVSQWKDDLINPSTQSFIDIIKSTVKKENDSNENTSC